MFILGRTPTFPCREAFLTITPETWRYPLALQEDGHHLRIYESAGQECDVEVNLPFAARACESVDLNGRPWEPPRIDLRQNRARFHVHPWEIVTLRFSASGSRG